MHNSIERLMAEVSYIHSIITIIIIIIMNFTAKINIVKNNGDE